MAVVGSSTALLATISYVPPFQPYTSTVTNYIGGPVSTSTSSGVPTGTANPTVPQSTDDHTYVVNYLSVHQLSTQSYRYPLLLWLIFLALLLLFTILHHLSFRAGFLSSLWSKLAIKRKVIRTKGQKASDKRSGEFLSRRLTVGRGGGGGGGGAVGGKGKRKRNVVLPSNGQLMAGSVLVLLVAACCVVGADYIDPTTSAWNVGTSFFSKRQSGSGSDSLQIPQYTIGKSWWTSGSRFGLIGFALFPLVVLLALKAPPFAILSLKIFTHLHSDKLALLHRWSGRLIWLVTTIHVVLWTVQLFIDQRGDGEGRSMWFVVWIYDKFQWAVVGYAGMTGLMATSFKPIRQRAYEFFYLSHVCLVALTLFGSVMHYPKLWYWIAVATILWLGERSYRWIRFGWINGWFGGLDRRVQTMAGPKFASVATTDEMDAAWSERMMPAPAPVPQEEYGMTPLQRKSNYSAYAGEDYEKTLPRVPSNPFQMGNHPSISDFGAHVGQGQDQYAQGSYAQGSYAQGTFDSRFSHAGSFDERDNTTDGYEAGSKTESTLVNTPLQEDPRLSAFSNHSSGYGGPTSALAYDQGGGRIAQPMTASSSYQDFSKAAVVQSQPRPMSTPGHRQSAVVPTRLPVIIPSGYGHAQLLPSRTVRLTIRVPRPFQWHPGQHVLLYVPEVARFQSHPFSIVSAWKKNQETEIILIIKARKGFTAKLYELVRQKVYSSSGLHVEKDKRQSFGSLASMAKQPEPPAIMLRCLLDGPFGSVARARPGHHSSLLIVCGGSGVSFGVPALLHFSDLMAKSNAPGRKRRWGGSEVKRIRFVWIVREFAEIAWVSTLLKQCLDIAPRDSIQLDIFVTDSNPNLQIQSMVMSGEYDYEPPRPQFAGRGSVGGPSIPRAGSFSSEMGMDEYAGEPSYVVSLPPVQDHDTSPTSGDFSILDLTNYEDEEDIQQSSAQAELSKKLKKQGRLMRAKSRKYGKNGSLGERQDFVAPQPQYAQQSGRPRISASPSFDHGYAAPLMDSRSQTPQPGAGPPSPFGRPESAAYNDREPSPYEGAYGDGTDANEAYLELRPKPGHAYRPSLTPSMPSMADTSYARYDPYSGGMNPSGAYSPSPSVHTFGMNYDTKSLGGESGMSRPFVSHKTTPSRAHSQVLLEGAFLSGGAASGKEDAGIWLDQVDYDSMMVISEFARPGRPKFGEILREEMERAQGTLGVGTCGPASLNAVVRNTVAKNLSLSRIASGDRRGVVELFSEDYEA